MGDSAYNLNWLVEQVWNLMETNNIEDFEEYRPNEFNIVNIPQAYSSVGRIIGDAKSLGIKVYKKRSHTIVKYIKFSVDKDTWIRFNLYVEDEPYYGKKGDINSLDISKIVYDKLEQRLFDENWWVANGKLE